MEQLFEKRKIQPVSGRKAKHAGPKTEMVKSVVPDYACMKKRRSLPYGETSLFLAPSHRNHQYIRVGKDPES